LFNKWQDKLMEIKKWDLIFFCSDPLNAISLSSVTLLIGM